MEKNRFLPLYLYNEGTNHNGQPTTLTSHELALVYSERCGFTLHLRKLEDLTDDEKFAVATLLGCFERFSQDARIAQVTELFARNGFTNKVTNISGSSWTKTVNYLRSIHVDVDGLIEAGIAKHKK